MTGTFLDKVNAKISNINLYVIYAFLTIFYLFIILLTEINYHLRFIMGTTENKVFNCLSKHSSSLDLPEEKKYKICSLLEQVMEDKIVQEFRISRSNDNPYVVVVPSVSCLKNSFLLHTFWEGISYKLHNKKLNEIFNEVFNRDFIKTLLLS